MKCGPFWHGKEGDYGGVEARLMYVTTERNSWQHQTDRGKTLPGFHRQVSVGKSPARQSGAAVKKEVFGIGELAEKRQEAKLKKSHRGALEGGSSSC